MYGTIRSYWIKDEEEMVVEVTVPSNTTATITLPNAKTDNILESGTYVNEAKGIQSCTSTNSDVVIDLGSGS